MSSSSARYHHFVTDIWAGNDIDTAGKGGVAIVIGEGTTRLVYGHHRAGARSIDYNRRAAPLKDVRYAPGQEGAQGTYAVLRRI